MRSSRQMPTPIRFGRSFARWAKIPTRGHSLDRLDVQRGGHGRIMANECP
jgi:hypothetical protein